MSTSYIARYTCQRQYASRQFAAVVDTDELVFRGLVVVHLAELSARDLET